MTVVTCVTHDATLDDLSAQDYRDIYVELRRLEMEPADRLSFDKFIALIGSRYTKGQWAKYHDGDISLNRTMRSELRVAMGKDPLPPTVADAVAQASPDAAVWTVGDGVPEHVIMVSDTPVTLYVNGSVSTVLQTCDVTKVTPGKVQRKRYVRPCIPESYSERLAGLVDVSWLDVIEAGMRVYENAC